jgi:hypothetical protein
LFVVNKKREECQELSLDDTLLRGHQLPLQLVVTNGAGEKKYVLLFLLLLLFVAFCFFVLLAVLDFVDATPSNCWCCCCWCYLTRTTRTSQMMMEQVPVAKMKLKTMTGVREEDALYYDTLWCVICYFYEEVYALMK